MCLSSLRLTFSHFFLVLSFSSFFEWCANCSFPRSVEPDKMYISVKNSSALWYWLPLGYKAKAVCSRKEILLSSTVDQCCEFNHLTNGVFRFKDLLFHYGPKVYIYIFNIIINLIFRLYSPPRTLAYQPTAGLTSTCQHTEVLMRPVLG